MAAEPLSQHRLNSSEEAQTQSTNITQTGHGNQEVVTIPTTCGQNWVHITPYASVTRFFNNYELHLYYFNFTYMWLL